MPGVIVTGWRAVAVVVLAAVAAGCAAGPARPVHDRKPPVTANARRPGRAARAAGLPGIYLGSMAGPWYGPSVRPGTLDLGADWTISQLRWTAWTRQHATGRGHYLACSGAGGPCVRYWAEIVATHVLNHRGSSYFALMKLTGGHPQVQWLVMNKQLGWWQQARPH